MPGASGNRLSTRQMADLSAGLSSPTRLRESGHSSSNELRALLKDMVRKALIHSPEVRVANANEAAAGARRGAALEPYEKTREDLGQEINRLA